MLTALNIEYSRRRGFRRVLSALRHNRIRVAHRYCDAAAVKCITYECRRGRVNWTALDRFIKAQRNHLLCPPALELPDSRGYRRFVSHELSRRMCENAAIYLLDTLKDYRIKTVLVDDDGSSIALCGYLSAYCDPLYVVSSAREAYAIEAERLLEEKGAALVVAATDSVLTDADLVIVPGCLYRDLGCPEPAVVLSGERPVVTQNAPVVYDYFIDLPEKYASIKPEYLDDMYFASALYAMAGAHELGSYIFRRCGDGRVIHTRLSLTEQLKKRLNP